MPIQSKQQPPYYNEGKFVKIYTALITQTSTDAPTATILQNQIGNIIWSYTGVGTYTATLNNTFIGNKTWISYEMRGENPTHSMKAFTPDSDFINIYTFADGEATDGLLNNTSIEIRIYQQ